MAKKTQRAPHPSVVQEILPARHHTGDTVPTQALLQQLRLPPGAVEHGDVPKGTHRLPVRRTAPLGRQHIHASHHAPDLLGHKDGFGEGTLRREDADRRACGPDGLQHPGRTAVSSDDRQRTAHDLRRRAVIFDQSNGGQVFQILLHPLEAPRVGATKTVNRLVRVPDDKKALSLPPPSAEQPALHSVAVLELVYQQVREAPLRRGPGAVLLPQLQRLQEQIVKVQKS